MFKYFNMSTIEKKSKKEYTKCSIKREYCGRNLQYDKNVMSNKKNIVGGEMYIGIIDIKIALNDKKMKNISTNVIESKMSKMICR